MHFFFTNSAGDSAAIKASLICDGVERNGINYVGQGGGQCVAAVVTNRHVTNCRHEIPTKIVTMRRRSSDRRSTGSPA